MRKKEDRYTPNHVIGTLLVSAFCIVVFWGQSLWVPASRLENLYARTIVLSITDSGAAFASWTGFDKVIPELRTAFLDVSGLSANTSWDTRYYNKRNANLNSSDSLPSANQSAASAVLAGTDAAGTGTEKSTSVIGQSETTTDTPVVSSVKIDTNIDSQISTATTVSSGAPFIARPSPNDIHSAEHPLSVYMFGDSQVFSLGSGLSRLAGKNSSVDVEYIAVHSSGFIRDDYYNWPAKLVDTFQAKKYDAAVMMLGMNDYQSFMNDRRVILKKRTSEWEAAYRERCRALIDIVLTSVPRLYWIGMPVVKNTAYSESLAYIDSIQQSVADEYSPDILVRVPLKDTIPGKDKPFSPSFETGDGKKFQVMSADGTHFTVEGGQLAMKPLFDFFTRDFLFSEIPVAHLPE